MTSGVRHAARSAAATKRCGGTAGMEHGVGAIGGREDDGAPSHPLGNVLERRVPEVEAFQRLAPALDIDKAARSGLKGQTACAPWLTGFSAATAMPAARSPR